MKRKPSELVSLVVSLVCILVLGACNCAPTLRYIVITPATSLIAVGTTQQFTATGYYSNGAITPGISASWGTGTPSVATIDPTGVATGVAIGTTTITATALGITAAPATLNVNQLLSLTIAPLNQTIALNGTEQYTALGTFKNPDGTTGTPTDVTSLVTWTAGTDTVATFSTDTPGLATGIAGGTTTISASLDGVNSNTTNLTVGGTLLVITPSVNPIAVGNSVTFTVVEQTGSVTTPPAYPVTITSGTPGVANVVPNGTAGAIGAGFAVGSTVITATEASPIPLSGSVTLNVDAGTAKYAYVSNSTAPYSVQTYGVTASAAPYLTSTGTTGTGGNSPSQTILDPNGKYMFLVSTGAATNVTVYNVAAATGVVTNAGFTPSTVDPSAPQSTYGITDPYGRFLFVCDVNDTANANGAIYAYKISQTNGALTPVAGSPFTANLNGPVGLLIDQSGQYLYATNGNVANLSAYSINQTTGALTALATPTYATGNGPLFSTWDPTGTYMYIANDGDGTVTGYTLGTAGALGSATTTTVTGSTALFSLAVSPNGSTLYVLDAGETTGALYGFTLTAGAPSATPIAGSPYTTGNNPFTLAIDPTGSILAVNNVGDGSTASLSNISVYTIASDGTLTAQPTVATGLSPYFVTFYNVP
jgi:6-phosphogluconolactonase